MTRYQKLEAIAMGFVIAFALIVGTFGIARAIAHFDRWRWILQ